MLLWQSAQGNQCEKYRTEREPENCVHNTDPQEQENSCDPRVLRQKLAVKLNELWAAKCVEPDVPPKDPEQFRVECEKHRRADRRISTLRLLSQSEEAACNCMRFAWGAAAGGVGWAPETTQVPSCGVNVATNPNASTADQLSHCYLRKNACYDHIPQKTEEEGNGSPAADAAEDESAATGNGTCQAWEWQKVDDCGRYISQTRGLMLEALARTLIKDFDNCAVRLSACDWSIRACRHASCESRSGDSCGVERWCDAVEAPAARSAPSVAAAAAAAAALILFHTATM